MTALVAAEDAPEPADCGKPHAESAGPGLPQAGSERELSAIAAADSLDKGSTAPPHLALRPISLIPEWLRFNPYVLDGYRPPMTALQCTRSLCTLHNETGNVWSHLLTAAYFAHGARCHGQAGGPADAALAAACACMALSMGCSVGYHLYSPCCRTAGCYCTLLSLDVGAIIIALAGSQLITLLYGDSCLEHTTLHNLLFVFYAVAMATLCGSLFQRTVLRRAALIGAFSLFRMATSAYVYAAQWGHPRRSTAPVWHALAYGGMFLGGYVNAARLPERHWPGRFDLWLNSHQLMHLLVAGAMVCSYWGARADVRAWEACASCCA